MAIFVSILLTFGCAYWFFRTSERLGAKSVQWAFAGALAYQVPAWGWMTVVARPYVAALRGMNKTSTSAYLIGHSWILVGAVAAFLVYRFFLLKTDVRGSGPALGNP